MINVINLTENDEDIMTNVGHIRMDILERIHIKLSGAPGSASNPPPEHRILQMIQNPEGKVSRFAVRSLTGHNNLFVSESMKDYGREKERQAYADSVVRLLVAVYKMNESAMKASLRSIVSRNKWESVTSPKWGRRGGPEKWNSLGFTKITGKQKEWSKASNGHPTLAEIGHPVEGRPNAVLMFHGTSSKCTEGICKQMELETDPTLVGGGALGPGFYLTFNPWEAFDYACDRSKRRNRVTHMTVLEFLVENADELKNRKDYIRNAISTMRNQIALKTVRRRNLKLIRAHNFKVSEKCRT